MKEQDSRQGGDVGAQQQKYEDDDLRAMDLTALTALVASGAVPLEQAKRVRKPKPENALNMRRDGPKQGLKERVVENRTNDEPFEVVDSGSKAQPPGLLEDIGQQLFSFGPWLPVGGLAASAAIGIAGVALPWALAPTALVLTWAGWAGTTNWLNTPKGGPK